MNKKRMGKIIQKMRIEKEMTRLVLSKKMSCSPTTIFKWERGLMCPSMENLTKLESILGMNILSSEFMEAVVAK
ncbi:helix-turn-helix domain-containing protein [Candidatus Uabimicrobium amorphum]|uniref:Transcriptional regulator n=1 Tax=Uabimicrobium amorphum TaxID=2596890 RepID=A0A5S9INB5_UABAM|nr:helix-turn-helix transcriptional regulator [Candidatus Uabimicrobium amorphum]BBM84681.1 transcriptional regulator [Candidatus Uabimicrobium amorphum]